jgi:uncharacterized protein (TIGR00730 family)
MFGAKSIAVYCGSSETTPDIYKQAAKDLGRVLAQNKIELVYGGSRQGLMGLVAEAALSNGGRVYGVISKFLDSKEGGYQDITELYYVDNMHQRKQKMFERADAFVVLPGGMGTLDELCEILTWKQLGLHSKTIVILDINHYWSDLFCHFIDHMAANNFIRPEDKNLFTLVERVEDLLPFFQTHSSNQTNYVAKWG